MGGSGAVWRNYLGLHPLEAQVTDGRSLSCTLEMKILTLFTERRQPRKASTQGKIMILKRAVVSIRSSNETKPPVTIVIDETEIIDIYKMKQTSSAQLLFLNHNVKDSCRFDRIIKSADFEVLVARVLPSLLARRPTSSEHQVTATTSDCVLLRTVVCKLPSGLKH